MQYVNTGEVCSGGPGTILYSGAVGSCVVITAFNPEKIIGVMAHIMLPGVSQLKSESKDTRYASNAIEEMLIHLDKLEAEKENTEFCILGGGNVLKRAKDNIGRDNIYSIENILFGKKIKIGAQSIGGFERRTVLFDISKGCIYYTIGDSKQKILRQTRTII